MLNQLIVIGRLVKDPELKKTETGKNVANITLAVPRSYKNPDGEYDTDFIDCILWNNVAESTSEYCSKGDLLGVKGRIQTRKYETEDEKTRQVTEFIAEKVTFLSSNRKNIETDNNEISKEDLAELKKMEELDKRDKKNS